jgi:HSP20 family protein
MADERGQAAEKPESKAEESGKVPVTTGETGERGVPSVFEEAWHPFMSLRREMDRVFEDFVSRFGTFPFRRSGFELEPFRRIESMFRPSVPAMDFVEQDKEYVVSAELPGLDEKNLEVKLSGDVLTIRGEKKEEREEERPTYRLSERRYGSFQRSVQLPADVDAEKIDARFVKGVLTVTLPKSEEAMKKQRNVEVKAE